MEILARKHAGPPQTSIEQVTEVPHLTTDPSYLLSTRCNVYIHLTCDPIVEQLCILTSIENQSRFKQLHNILRSDFFLVFLTPAPFVGTLRQDT